MLDGAGPDTGAAFIALIAADRPIGFIERPLDRAFNAISGERREPVLEAAIITVDRLAEPDSAGVDQLIVAEARPR